MSKIDLTAARLREVLHYEPETGVFTWRIKISRNRMIGGKAGSYMALGYIAIGVDCHLYTAHRLAFLYMTGEWPKYHVDHINGIRNDNRWTNLRDVAQRVNAENRRGPQADNTTGFLGVFRHNGGDRFRAQLKVKGKTVWLGAFDTAEQAHAAYLGVKRRLHEGCTI